MSSNKVYFWGELTGALHQRKCEFSQRLKRWFRSKIHTSEGTSDRAKGGSVINYSCCMTVRSYVCSAGAQSTVFLCLEVQIRSSATENRVSAGKNFAESVCVSVCLYNTKCQSTLKYRSSVTGYTPCWSALLFVCVCVYECVCCHCASQYVQVAVYQHGLEKVSIKSVLTSLPFPLATLSFYHTKTFLYHYTCVIHNSKDAFTHTSISLTDSVNGDYLMCVSVYKLVAEAYFSILCTAANSPLSIEESGYL